MVIIYRLSVKERNKHNYVCVNGSMVCILKSYVHFFGRIFFALVIFALKTLFLVRTVAYFVVRKSFDERGRASGVFSEVTECQKW